MDAKPRNNSMIQACTEYEPLLEDHLAGELAGAEAKRLSEHLTGCTACRAALDDAAATSRLLRVAGPLLDRAPDPGPAFSRIVMARIRAEAGRPEERSIWLPLVSFGWRFAMSAGLALALLVAYATRSEQPAQNLPTTQGPETHDLFSDPSISPMTRGEVLLMVAESKNARQ
jgi:anti-sigma factor RsiW